VTKGEGENSNIKTILQIIQKLPDRNDNYRFIVFVKTRAVAVALSRYLNTCETPVVCNYLTGHGKSSNDGNTSN